MNQVNSFHSVFGEYLVDKGFKKHKNCYFKLINNEVIQTVSVYTNRGGPVDITFGIDLLYPFTIMEAPDSRWLCRHNLGYVRYDRLVEDYKNGS